MDLQACVSLTQEQLIGILANASAVEIMVVALANCHIDKTQLWEAIQKGVQTKLQAAPSVDSSQEKEAQDLFYSKLHARIQLLLDAAGCG